MKQRRGWQQMLEDAWTRRTVLWLMGVRRVGKTVLCRSLPDVEYFDCEIPRIARQVEDPEAFLGGLEGRRIILDEIHRLRDPSRVLKIAADHFSAVRVLATGSSTLTASAHFRDSLVGRKEDLWLTPMNLRDLQDFGHGDIRHRFLHGGLPPFFLADTLPERDFGNWMEAYWARDVMELFRVEKRPAFLRLIELLLAQSGGIFEASRFARECEVSRPTILNYLGVLESTFVAHVLRPYSRHRGREIVAAPKVYGFDTGFVCYYREWYSLRKDDHGPLWEHLVLNELHSSLQSRRIHYWRSKQGHEVDFVLRFRGKSPVAVECKWSAGSFDPTGLAAFRKLHPGDDNFVVAADVERPFVKSVNDLRVRFVGLASLRDEIVSFGIPYGRAVRTDGKPNAGKPTP